MKEVDQGDGSRGGADAAQRAARKLAPLFAQAFFPPFRPSFSPLPRPWKSEKEPPRAHATVRADSFFLLLSPLRPFLSEFQDYAKSLLEKRRLHIRHGWKANLIYSKDLHTVIVLNATNLGKQANNWIINSTMLLCFAYVSRIFINFKTAHSIVIPPCVFFDKNYYLKIIIWLRSSSRSPLRI